MEKETQDRILGCFDTAGSDALVTGDHAWGSTPRDATRAREDAIQLLKENFPGVSEKVLEEVVVRGVGIKRGAYMGNLELVLQSQSTEFGQGKVASILRRVFKGHDTLASFRKP